MSHQLSRRDFLKRLGAVGAVSALPSFFNQIDCKNSPGRPNFIVFLADDLGCGDLACYGHPIIQSPNLDRFAQEGMRFTDCHSGGTVCSPSRASLLTGRNPYRVGI
jgi:arylsulfatase A